MFTKHRRVGGIYKKETDWGAVFGVAFWVIVILAILGSLAVLGIAERGLALALRLQDGGLLVALGAQDV